MSDDKKQKSNWRLLLVGVVLGSVMTVGAFWISDSDFNKAKNLVVNIVKNLKGDFGFGETKIITTTREKEENPSQQIHFGKSLLDKTLWDWLNLLAVGAVPIVIAFFGYQWEQRNKKEQARLEREKYKQARLEKKGAKQQGELEKERAEKQAELEREIAQHHLFEEAIQNYLNNMSKLLLDKELRKELFPNVNDILNPSDCDNPVRDVARIQTITILRRLEDDTYRQARIIHFLRDAELYKFILKKANLSGINLSQAHLMGANLQQAILGQANLQQAFLVEANLQQAFLGGASLQQADLYRANLQQAVLWGASLQQAALNQAKVQKAALERASLQQADLQQADLRRANLQQADLGQANLKQAFLGGVKNLTSKQIKSACFWSEAIYKGEWDWEEETKTWVAKNEQAKQDNKNFIEDLKKDFPSNQKVDCSIWSDSNST